MDRNLILGLEGARLKVERACRHIDELAFSIDNLKNLEPKKLLERPQPDGSVIIRVSDLGPQRLALALPLGDAIHNMRASLDHAWTALARSAWLKQGSKGAEPKFELFPFHETRRNVIDALTKSTVTKIHPTVQQIIIDKIKPHRDEGGNEVFWTITKFDKIDKHNLLIPIIEITKFGRLIINAGGMIINMSNSTGHSFVNLAHVRGPVTYQGEIDISFEVTFPQENFLAGEPILPTLINMANSTREAIDFFKKEFIPI